MAYPNRCVRCRKPKTTPGAWCVGCHAIVKIEMNSFPPAGCVEVIDECVLTDEARGTRRRFTIEDCKPQRSTGKKPQYQAEVIDEVRRVLRELTN